MTRIRRLAKLVYFPIAIFTAILIIFKSAGYFNPDFSHGFLSGKKLFFDGHYKYFLYMHILAAPLTIFAGILQFSLSRKNVLHRVSGYVYMIAVVIAAAGGLVMSFYSLGGAASGISFLALSVLWLVFTFKAFSSIRKGDVEAHKRMMTRSFILANSAILLRLFSFISNHFTQIDPVSAYVFISWFSWVPWLLMYETMRFFR
jgi:uncharacterized membrane protein